MLPKTVLLGLSVPATIVAKPTDPLASPNCSGQSAAVSKISSSVANPTCFCQQWLGSDRKHSPLCDFTPTALVAPCECAVQAARQPVPMAGSRPCSSPSMGPHTCDYAYAAAIQEQFSDAEGLCKYILEATHWQSTVWGLSMEQALRGCQCILPPSICTVFTTTTTVVQSPVTDLTTTTITETVWQPVSDVTFTITEPIVTDLITTTLQTATKTLTEIDTITSPCFPSTVNISLPCQPSTVTANEIISVTVTDSITDLETVSVSVTQTDIATFTVTKQITLAVVTSIISVTTSVTDYETITVTSMVPTTVSEPITDVSTATTTVSETVTMTVTASTAPTANLVMDGGFETSSDNVWFFNPDIYRDGSATASSASPGQNSSTAIRFQVSSTGFNTQGAMIMTQSIDDIQVGTEYAVSLAYRVEAVADQDSHTCFMTLYMENQLPVPNLRSYYIGSQDFDSNSVSPNWVPVTGTFTALDSQLSVLVTVICSDGIGSMTLSVDDVSVVAI